MGRTLAITGAASGLGAALVARARAAGDTPIGVDRREGDGVDVVADLGTPEGRAAAVAAVRERCGDRLDGLVSAAGTTPLDPDPANVVSVNHFGALQVLDDLLPALRAGADPAAVVISSLGAVDGSADTALTDLLLAGDEAAARAAAADGTDFRSAIAYSAAKLGVARAIRHRAAAWGAAGVRLNAVAPGRMETPMLDGLLAHPVYGPGIESYPTGVQASGSAAAVAGAVWFLLGPDASFVHGQVLFADGGTEAILRPDTV